MSGLGPTRTMEGDPEQPPGGVAVQRRAVLIVAILVCIGLPFAVVTQLHLTRDLDTVPSGDQPGGIIAGHLVTEDGRPLADLAVELQLVAKEGRTIHSTSRTDGDGRFELRAPPVAGYYVIEAGGGGFQRVARGVSFLTAKGEVQELEPLELALPLGATLRVTLTRADGRPASGGTLYLEGRTAAGFLFGLVPAGIRLERSFSAGVVVVDDLPSSHGDVRIVLESGDRVEFPFEVEAGHTLERAFEF